MKTSGIHHITAIASDAQTNIDFYSSLLGLRLIKITVNYDDPGSYHLYYGDAEGRPGSALTFFIWPGAYRGSAGSSHVTRTIFAVPTGSLAFWQTRLAAAYVAAEKTESGVRFRDPDGMELELSEHPASSEFTAWERSDIPAQYAIRGFAGAILSTARADRTAGLLAGTLGLKETGNQTFSFDGSAAFIRLHDTGLTHNRMGAGVVHHIAFRATDDSEQLELLGTLQSRGTGVSPVMNRNYFHSIYFREPGGILFEVATDQPGFMIDEDARELGTTLALPKWMEERRPEITAALPVITIPDGSIIPS